MHRCHGSEKEASRVLSPSSKILVSCCFRLVAFLERLLRANEHARTCCRATPDHNSTRTASVLLPICMNRVCNKAVFTKLSSIHTTEVQTPLVQTPVGKSGLSLTHTLRAALLLGGSISMREAQQANQVATKRQWNSRVAFLACQFASVGQIQSVAHSGVCTCNVAKVPFHLGSQRSL